MSRSAHLPVPQWARCQARRAAAIRDRGIQLCFGDQLGFTLFLGVLFVVLLRWQHLVFINDNNTLVNALVAVADGHLYFEEIVAGPVSGDSPGTYRVGTRLYGRNYGHVFLSLPVLWALKGLSLVVDLRVAIIGAWSVLWLVVWQRTGRLGGQRIAFEAIGAVGALVLFGINLLFATPLPVDAFWLPLMALQLTTMGMAALCGVVLYRLLTRLYGSPIGIAGGLTTVLATPVGFWAAIPKRHVPMALLVLCTVYCFYRSRSAQVGRDATRFRALTYAFVGIAAWLSAPEALLLLLTLVPVDLMKARSNHPRQLLFIGGVFCLSAVPFLVTNTMIAGTPFEPPQYLYATGGHPALPSGSGDPVGGAQPGTTPTQPASNTPTAPTPSFIERVSHPILAVVTNVLEKSQFLTVRFERSLTLIRHDPTRIWQIFVRSAQIPGIQTDRVVQQPIQLAFLEALPLAGVILGGLTGTIGQQRWRARLWPQSWSPVRQTDALIVGYSSLLFLLYIPNLPIHASITVRYLLPAMPLFIYATCRSVGVRTAIETYPWILGRTYAVGVVLGGLVVLFGLVWFEPTLSDTMQFHALSHLVGASLLVLWAAVATRRPTQLARLGAVLLGTTAAATTVFLLLAGWAYFVRVDRLALPLVRVLADAVSLF